MVGKNNKLTVCNLSTPVSNDIWRFLNPSVEQFTWRNKSFKKQCRLDFFLISTKLNALTDKYKIVYTAETEHSAIMIHLKSDELKHKRGIGFWKFNQSLLQDEIFVSNLRAEIPDFKQKYVDVEDLRLKYSKNKAKKRKSAEINLQNQINELYKKAETQPMKSMMPDCVTLAAHFNNKRA